MEKYVDGFLLPIAKDKVDEYREIARKAGEVWMEHGALEFHECLGDDLESEGMFSFRTAANAADNETVIFSWIVFESKEQRDKVNAAVMEDERIKDSMDSKNMPFDFKRMAYGGFKTLVKF